MTTYQKEKRCSICGAAFIAKSPPAKYCEQCRKDIKKTYSQRYYEKKKEKFSKPPVPVENLIQSQEFLDVINAFKKIKDKSFISYESADQLKKDSVEDFIKYMARAEERKKEFGKVTYKKLQELSGLPPSTFNKVLKNMEYYGFINKKSNYYYLDKNYIQSMIKRHDIFTLEVFPTNRIISTGVNTIYGLDLNDLNEKDKEELKIISQMSNSIIHWVTNMRFRVMKKKMKSLYENIEELEEDPISKFTFHALYWIIKGMHSPPILQPLNVIDVLTLSQNLIESLLLNIYPDLNNCERSRIRESIQKGLIKFIEIDKKMVEEMNKMESEVPDSVIIVSQLPSSILELPYFGSARLLSQLSLESVEQDEAKTPFSELLNSIDLTSLENIINYSQSGFFDMSVKLSEKDKEVYIKEFMSLVNDSISTLNLWILAEEKLPSPDEIKNYCKAATIN